ncbi:MAG: hypothetical protein HFE99_01155 [Ruminiclostridium sp.]|jgi:parvulin-like peptidyl-prolyl isomerase|nr:hypothetical protein [Ruminiclostridium sp.]
MKNIRNRALALVLALVLLTGLLSGCGQEEDPIQEAFGFPGDTVMLTVDGNDVTASDLMYWMAYNADYIAQYYQTIGQEIDWSATLGGSQPVGEYVKEQSRQTAILYSTVTAHTAAAGYSFDPDDADYKVQFEEAKENMGGQEEFQRFLKEMCLTEDSFHAVNSVALVYQHMQEGICRKGGEYEPSQEELKQYVADKDLLSARHILLMTKDPQTNEALSQEQAAEKKTKAEGFVSQLQAIEDPKQRSDKFNELMKANSEDSGLASYPNGYLFGAGEMVAEFEEATRGLEIGQVSGIVESNYGYHIILRDDPTQSEELLNSWAETKMQDLSNEWVTEAVVEDKEAFTNLDVADFYAKLTAYRDSLQAEDEGQEDTNSGEDANSGKEDGGQAGDSQESDPQAPAQEGGKPKDGGTPDSKPDGDGQ